MTDYTVEEQVICYLARSFDAEDSLGVFGVNNCMSIAMSLAKELYAPRLSLLAWVKGKYGVLGKLRFPFEQGQVPEDWIETLYSSEEAFAMVNSGKYLVVMQPVQIDQRGFMNLSLLGDMRKPKHSFVGSRGCPNNTVMQPRTFYFVPNHSPRVFVKRVDFRSGVGYGEERRSGLVRWGAPIEVITNLCIIDFDAEIGKARLKSLHKGITRPQVEENTGFELIVPDDLAETGTPTEAELRLIRGLIDPLGVRRLDFASRHEYARIEAEIQAGMAG